MSTSSLAKEGQVNGGAGPAQAELPVLCVTDRSLCNRPLPEQVKRILKLGTPNVCPTNATARSDDAPTRLDGAGAWRDGKAMRTDGATAHPGDAPARRDDAGCSNAGVSEPETGELGLETEAPDICSALPRPTAVLLREKDLDARAYAQLARELAPVCAQAGVPLVIHTHVEVARVLGCRHLHLTLPVLAALAPGELQELAAEFELSTSCHSATDAVRAAECGCARIIAGHVYETGCKPGLEPRGLAFLRAVCAAVDIPVWAIGGVTPARLSDLRAAGAAGACIRSPYMLSR